MRIIRYPQQREWSQLCARPHLDNQELAAISLNTNASPEIFTIKEGALAGIPALKTSGRKKNCNCTGLYCTEKPNEANCRPIAIPYYSWCNRNEGAMKVWMPV